MATPGDLIAVGPPPLTQQAADCSLDIIDFMAAVVRGVDLIDVTPEMRQSWRAYLAMYYPALAPVDRYWFASAPFMLANLQATWPQLAEPQRMMYRQAWSASLPAMLQFIDPVLRESHQQAPPQSVARLVQSVRNQQQQAAASPATDPDLQAQKDLYDYHVNSMTLQRFSTMAATNTIDLMHAMSGR